jgi:uncharacterized protein with NRDE domain
VAGEYNGFSLLVADEDSLWLYSNRDEAPPRALEPGVYGLSNHLLDTPWPKVAAGAERLRAALALTDAALVHRLLALLEDRTVPPDAELPSTGVGVELERLLAPAFISSPTYGTRASYAVLLDRSGEIIFVERPFDAGGPSGDPVRFTFQSTDG